MHDHIKRQQQTANELKKNYYPGLDAGVRDLTSNRAQTINKQAQTQGRTPSLDVHERRRTTSIKTAWSPFFSYRQRKVHAQFNLKVN